MDSNQIRGWFQWLRQQVENTVGVPISNLYNQELALYRGIERTRDWLRTDLDNAARSAPWPINEITSWFVWLLWTAILTPAFDTALAAARVPMDALNALWDAGRGWWVPAIWAGDRVDNLRDFVVWLSDTLSYIVGQIDNVVTGLWDWLNNPVTGQIPQLWGLVWSLRNQVAAIQLPDLGPIYAAINQLWGALGQIQIPDLTTLWAYAMHTNAVLWDLSQSLQPLVTDPAGYVWSRLEPTITERARLLLLRLW